MTPYQEHILDLEQVLADVVVNLQEDFPEAQWSKHLRVAVNDAIVLLSTSEVRH